MNFYLAHSFVVSENVASDSRLLLRGRSATGSRVLSALPYGDTPPDLLRLWDGSCAQTQARRKSGRLLRRSDLAGMEPPSVSVPSPGCGHAPPLTSAINSYCQFPPSGWRRLSLR